MIQVWLSTFSIFSTVCLRYLPDSHINSSWFGHFHADPVYMSVNNMLCSSDNTSGRVLPVAIWSATPWNSCPYTILIGLAVMARGKAGDLLVSSWSSYIDLYISQNAGNRQLPWCDRLPEGFMRCTQQEPESTSWYNKAPTFQVWSASRWPSLFKRPKPRASPRRVLSSTQFSLLYPQRFTYEYRRVWPSTWLSRRCTRL